VRVHRRIVDAGPAQQLADDRPVRAAGRLDRPAGERRQPVDLGGRGRERLRVLARRPLEQRAVDVEEQQEGQAEPLAR
jgi:hypothetical protein